MTTNQIKEDEQKFLAELFKQTKGDISGQVSMYTVGAALEMDKELSKRTAEELIGWNLAEIRTLSGGIGITSEGVEEAKKLGAGGFQEEGAVRLGNAAVTDDNARQAIEKIINDLKNRTGKLGLDFNALTELMADLKTIDAQLTSSKPKTAIFRECFRSVRGVLKNTADADTVRQISGLLGE
jgi:hypothetical protein